MHLQSGRNYGEDRKAGVSASLMMVTFAAVKALSTSGCRGHTTLGSNYSTNTIFKAVGCICLARPEVGGGNIAEMALGQVPEHSMDRDMRQTSLQSDRRHEVVRGLLVHTRLCRD